VVTADGVVEPYMPPFAIVVGAQVLVVSVTHDGLHVDRPLLTEVLEQRLQGAHGHSFQCARREMNNGYRKEGKGRQLTDLHACLTVSVVNPKACTLR